MNYILMWRKRAAKKRTDRDAVRFDSGAVGDIIFVMGRGLPLSAVVRHW